MNKLIERKEKDRAGQKRGGLPGMPANKLIVLLAIRTLDGMATLLAPPAMAGIMREYLEELEEREVTDLRSAEDYRDEIGEFIEAREPAEEEE